METDKTQEHDSFVEIDLTSRINKHMQQQVITLSQRLSNLLYLRALIHCLCSRLLYTQTHHRMASCKRGAVKVQHFPWEGLFTVIYLDLVFLVVVLVASGTNLSLYIGYLVLYT